MEEGLLSAGPTPSSLYSIIGSCRGDGGLRKGVDILQGGYFTAGLPCLVCFMVTCSLQSVSIFSFDVLFYIYIITSIVNLYSD